MFWYVTLLEAMIELPNNPNRNQKKNLKNQKFNPSLKIHSITTSFALIQVADLILTIKNSYNKSTRSAPLQKM